MTKTAKQLKPGDRFDNDGRGVERVIFNRPGPKGFRTIRTNRLDHIWRDDREVETMNIDSRSPEAQAAERASAPRLKTFRIYAKSVGRPGTPYYSPRVDYGTVQAPDKMRALDKVAEVIGVPHIERHQDIAVLGIGSVTVEEIA